MNTLDKLMKLLQLGIPQNLIANYTHCHKTTISKIARMEYQPTEKMLYLIEDGINRLYKDIQEILDKGE